MLKDVRMTVSKIRETSTCIYAGRQYNNNTKCNSILIKDVGRGCASI